MSVAIKIECPKCHADRTMLDSSFGVPACLETIEDASGLSINPKCAIPVRLVLCPRCHYIEMYHDLGVSPENLR